MMKGIEMIPIAKPVIGNKEIELVNKVLNSGNLAQGKMGLELEEKFSNLCGTKYAIAVNSGTAALHACMYSLGIKKGDEVITTPFTFVATANSILMQGAKPVFVDIDESDFNIEPKLIAEKVSKNTKAIEPVDLYGQLCDYISLRKIAKKYSLKIIEDACQSINAERGGVKAGNFGDAAAFSLYATKNVISGEGGIITTNDEEVMELSKRFRHHGQSEKTRYEYHDLGYNYRMMDLQAAIAIPQIERLDEITKKRISNARYLSNGLKNIEWINLPKFNDDGSHVFHQYTIRVGEKIRPKLLEHLKLKGIGAGIYYPKPLHLHPAFTRMGYKEGDFPIAERMAKEVLSLPVHPSITDEDMDYIIKVMGDFNP